VAIDIDGTRFFGAKEIAEESGVTRQTLWRWRRQGKIPSGYRFRNGQVLYTEEDRQQIWPYANRLEPLSDANEQQLSMFD